MKASVPVSVVSPPGLPVIHRFFDTPPFSPSGRFLGLTQFPPDDHLPDPGEEAIILLVDLQTGETVEIDRTVAWDTQLGAQVQWGATDHELVYNVGCVSTGDVRARVMDPHTGRFRDLSGSVYMMDFSGTRALSPNLLKMNQVQKGYGVHWAGPKEWAQTDSRKDGVRVTELAGGGSRLVLSVEQILESIPKLRSYGEARNGRYVCFHVKWNPQGSRIMLVFRFGSEDGRFVRNAILTANADGTDLRMALDPEVWKAGGHHPNWCPDGNSIMMNLQIGTDGLRFVRFGSDGAGRRVLSNSLQGSGHPTLHPDGRHILTDSYLYENGNRDWVPLRWVDLKEDREETLVRIPCAPAFAGPVGEWRIDPHPAWDATFTRVAFNCLSHGKRAVAVADLSSLIG
jgi:hypothetical protein